MNILDVIKRTVKAFPGCYGGMGAAIGMSPNVLRNKVSRSNDTHHLTVLEAMEIMEQARAANVPEPLALLKAMAAEFDMILVPAGERGPMGDLSLAERVLAHSAANSRLGMAVVEALADGVIDANEAEHISELRIAASQSDIELEQAARSFAQRSPVKAD